MAKRGRSEGGACSEGPVTRSKASRLRSGLVLPLLPASKRQCVSSASVPPAAPGARVPAGVAQVPSGTAGSTRAATRKQAAEAKGKGKLVMENTSDGSGHMEDKTKTRAADKKRDKGKEKEGDAGVARDMDTAARRAAATAQEAAEDVGGGVGGSATVAPGTASSALQGLLRKLGAGLDDLMLSGSPALSSARLKTILAGLRADGEEGRQLEALSSLCELLSIGTEDSLSSFSVDAFVPVLVNLLNCEYNSDIMLLAARALTHLTEVLPNTCQTIVHYGAVPAFCARLLTIEYIDLAEQSLQALEKISFEHPAAVLRAGGLLAVLSFLDFFSTGVQRVALSTAANICRQLPSDSVELIKDAVPILTNLLQYQDEKVVEHACVCLSSIAENWAPSSQLLDLLCSHGLIAQAARLIAAPASGAGPQAALSVATYTGLVRLLATCAAGSPAVVEALLEQGIITILRDALAGAAAGPATGAGPAALTRSPEQLYELMSLVSELLPPVADAGLVLPAAPPAEAGNRAARRKAAQEAGGSLAAVKEEPGGEAGGARERWLAAHPGLVEQYGRDLFPVLLQVYAASVNPAVRGKCLAAINKYLHFVRPDTLQAVLKDSNIAGFLAGVLVSKDAAVLNTALQIAEGLMTKLPQVFRRLFVKEGVLHALDALVASEPSLAPAPEAAGPSTADDSGAAASAGQTARPKRSSTKQRRKEEESEAPPSGASGKEGSLALGRSEGEAAGPSSGARALAQPSAGRAGLRLVAAARARRLKETYFGGGESESDDAARLKKLKELCAAICGGGKPAGDKGHRKAGKHKGKRGKERGEARDGADADVAALREVLDLLLEGDGVSTFEFVGSGVAPALLKLLTRGQAPAAPQGEPGAAGAQQGSAQALARLQRITDLLLPPAAAPEDAPLTVLVRKLQAALTSLERFPVMLSQAPAGARALGTRGSGGVAGGLSALTQPFKLRLSRAAGETALRDYSSNVVLIEPLATLAAVEDFLWHRVRGRADVPPTANGASTSGNSAAEAQLEAALAAAAAQFAANGRPGAGERAEERTAGTSAAGGSRPLTRAQKREAAAAAASENRRDGGAGKKGPSAPGTAAEPRVTRAAARRRAEAPDEGGGQKERGQAGEGAGGEHHRHELDSEEEAELHGIEYEEGLAMMEEDEDMSDDEEVYGEEALPVPDSVHDVQLGGDSPDDAALAPPPSRHAASGLPPPHPSTQRVPLDAGQDGASFAAALAGGRTRAPEAGREAKLQFSMGRRVLERHMTIFQAIQAQAHAAEEDADEDDARDADVVLPTSGRRLWDAVYTISYATAPPQAPTPSAAGAAGPGDAPAGPSAVGVKVGGASPLDVVRAPWLPEEVAPSRRAVREVLELLRLLEALSQLVPRMRAEAAADAVAEGRHATLQEALREQQARSSVRAEEFLSTKITPKLTRQMQDALALCSGSLPPWVHHLTAACPFLFPFEARRQYFHATAFGLSRALQRLQAQQSSDGAPVALDRDGREVRVGRLQRQKVRVSRQRILESAAKVFELYAAHKAVLEVEYFGEVGTGLGPTLEFYTLLSHELQKKHLHLWRADAPAPPDPKPADALLDSDADLMDLDDADAPGAPPEAVRSPAPGGSPVVCAESSFVHAPHGLFPRPLAPGAPAAERQRVVDHFRLLGRAMAKALQDNRMLDLPLAPAFYKLALGQALDLHDMVRLDPALGQQLEQLDLLIRRKKHLEAAGGAPGGAALLVGGVSVEELCLDFTLPGYPEYELKPGGADCSVTLGNLEEYVRLLLRATLADGVAPQVDAFRAGFNQVFPLASLRLFTPDELEALLCGKRELWTPESLAEHIKFDHGYTAGSPPIQHLLAIMGEFSPDEQRSFLRFVTGAPRLPPGGLSALTPRLTIVRKHPSGGSAPATLGSTPPGSALAPGTTLADGDLPSVMTCANYLKLPPYSCKAVMKDRLLYAIKEGQGSFDLS